jgi:hypothetical protein
MNTYAIIENNVVTNVIVWDGVSPYECSGDLILVPENLSVSIGWEYNNGAFIEPIIINPLNPIV